METLRQLKHENKIADYINENYPEWSFSKYKKQDIEICENGDVIYDGHVIIETKIRY